MKCIMCVFTDRAVENIKFCRPNWKILINSQPLISEVHYVCIHGHQDTTIHDLIVWFGKSFFQSIFNFAVEAETMGMWRSDLWFTLIRYNSGSSVWFSTIHYSIVLVHLVVFAECLIRCPLHHSIKKKQEID